MLTPNSPAEKRLTVLIVEDSPTQLEQLRFLLEEGGFTVVAATNGKEAMAAARASEPELVISDIVMPEMDGYELCKALRADEQLQRVPVILLTSLTDPHDVIRGLESGANNFICKPYDDRALLARVSNVLANQEIRKSSSSEMGINIFFAGQRFTITADRLQILDLLLSSYENAVSSSTELLRTRDELRVLNEQLEELVAERTAALTAEIEERKRAEVALREAQEAERHGRAVTSAVAETTTNFLAHGEVRRSAQLIVEHAVRVTGAGLGAFLDVDRKGRVLLRGVAGTQVPLGLEPLARVLRTLEKDGLALLEMGDNLLTAVIRNEAPVLTNDPERHPAWAGKLPPGHPAIENLLAIPLLSNGQVVGALALANRPGGFTDRERATVDALGNAAALVLRAARETDDRKSAQQQLQAAGRLEAVGRLAGGVAHDFNNLLTVILGCTGFALESVREDDAMAGDLREIEKAAKRAAELTGQLLAFSRKQVLQPRQVDLNALVTGFEKMLRRVIGEDLHLVLALAPELGVTLADPGQLEQVLMNLVVNARDAMPEGGKLTIETANVVLDEGEAEHHPAMNPGAYVQLAVTDTGCGMDEQTRTQIFEPFFTTKEKGKGTGLGLATVHGIVTQSGGSIGVYSEVGKGTTFRLYFPRTEGSVRAEPGCPAETARAVGNETVLVVEDEFTVRQLATRILEKAGYHVLAAANGAEALRASEEHHGEIHLVLTDVVMPDMGGRQIAERLAKLRPEIKVVFMSGYTDNAIVHHGILDPGTWFIGKPFRLAELTLKVRQVLDGKPRAASRTDDMPVEA